MFQSASPPPQPPTCMSVMEHFRRHFWQFGSWTVDADAASDFDPTALSGDVIGQILALRAEEHEMQLNQVAEFQTSELQNVCNDHTGFISACMMNLYNMLPTLENDCPTASANREVDVSGNHTDVFYNQQEEQQNGQDSCGKELVLYVPPDKCQSNDQQQNGQDSCGKELVLYIPPDKYQSNDQPYSSTIRKTRSSSKSSRVSAQRMAAGRDFRLKRKCTPRQRCCEANRRRRISETLKALQGLLPYSTGGFQASILDDVIKYVEYLQLQMKELSRCRLGYQPDPAKNPLFFLEGYNDHHNHGGTPEEFMADSLEFSPFAEINLLESRGLFVVPINIAEQLKPYAG